MTYNIELLAGTSGTRVTPSNKLVDNADGKLYNAREPLAHAGTHASGGSDPVTPAAIGAATAAQGALADSAVPNSRTINDKPLTDDVELLPSDLSMLSSSAMALRGRLDAARENGYRIPTTSDVTITVTSSPDASLTMGYYTKRAEEPYWASCVNGVPRALANDGGLLTIVDRWATSDAYGQGTGLELYTDSATLEIEFSFPNVTTSKPSVFVYVDGKSAGSWTRTTEVAGTYYAKLVHSDTTSTHRWVILTDYVNVGWAAARVSPDCTIWRGEKPFLALGIGDSIGNGSGAESTNLGYMSRARDALGIQMVNLSVGSTGYTAAVYPTHLEKISDFAELSYKTGDVDAFIIQSTINDANLTQETVLTDAVACWNYARAWQPNALIIITSPISAPRGAKVYQLTKKLAKAFVEWGDQNSVWVDLRDFVTLYNSATMLADTVHPTALGHTKLSEVFLSRLMHALKDRSGQATKTLYFVADNINNGGFNTEGTGGATTLAFWNATTSGTSTITRDVTVKENGVASCKFSIDASNSTAYISSGAIVVGQAYRATIRAKADVAGCYLAMMSPISEVGPLTTSWATYTVDFTSTYANLGLTRHTGCASRTIWVDEITLEAIV